MHIRWNPSIPNDKLKRDCYNYLLQAYLKEKPYDRELCKTIERRCERILDKQPIGRKQEEDT